MADQASESGLELHGAWIPGIPLGTYTLDVKQTVKGTGTNAPDWTFTSQSQEFSVGAPRYSLASADVLASFPAPGSTAPTGHLLPYIALRDPYFPWERPDPAPNGWGEAPTVAVLVLSDNEAVSVPTATGEAIDLLTKELGSALAPRITAPPSGNQATVIDVLVGDLRERLLPDPVATLPLLTHVRREVPQDPTGTRTLPQAHSAVIGSRFPRAMPDPAAPADRSKDHPCHYTAHLVSLIGHEENLMDNSLDAQVRLRLLSLWSWSFLTPAVDQASYADSFRRMLNRQKDTRQGDRLRYTPPASASDSVKNRMKASYVPMSHTLATGERTVSWYRGPFGPWPPPQTVPSPVHRPFNCADEALIYSTAECVFDLSLAAAWNIGYQLILSRRDLFGRLLTLKHDAQARIMSLVRITGTTAAEQYYADSSGVPETVVEAALNPVPIHQRFDAMMTGQRTASMKPLGEDITTALADITGTVTSVAPLLISTERASQSAADAQQPEGVLGGTGVPFANGERALAEHAATLVSHDGVARRLTHALRRRHLSSSQATASDDAPYPASQVTAASGPGEAAPAITSDTGEMWLWNAVELLTELPAWYLLPFSDAVLPTDSARFFSIDERWLSAFSDGMLAVGSHTAVDRLLEPLLGDVIFKPRHPEMAPACGLMIRSEIIRAWPMPPTTETAIGEAPTTTTDPGFFTVKGAKIVARTLIGQDTALLLFDKRPDSITLREPGHMMEFGLDNENGKKYTRKADGTRDAQQIDVYGEFLRDAPNKPGKPWPGHLPESLDVKGLAQRIGCIGKPAEFAFQMLNLPATLTLTPPPLS
ncbi:hypothetical protein [Streptomyces syringium]|uniref:hypothetical protein n=1 Tax=Streptomyces syringium TaxID=76729 RepID=UPI0034552604